MTDIKPNISAPFTIVSASNHGGYQDILDENGNKVEVLGIDFVNYHEDKPFEIEGTPLQSPFTERWVGGFSHRHIDINNDGLDNARNRPEAWHVSIKSSGVRLMSHKIYNSPPATFTRDGTAKRPLNIQNLLTTTASISYGNYSVNYEIVQTGGRFNNSLARNLITGSESLGSLRTRFVRATNADLDNTRPSLSDIEGVKTKSIFVSRFNAPGGYNESSRASLDVEGEEISPNISLTYRNNGVRSTLRTLLSGAMEQGNTNNMIHGVNRNTLRNMAGIVQKDNFYVQNSIPRTDIQYAWISSSALTTAIQLGGYQSGSLSNGTRNSDILFKGTLDDRVLNKYKKEYDVDLVTNTLKPQQLIELEALADYVTLNGQPTGSLYGMTLTGISAIKKDGAGRNWIVLMGRSPDDADSYGRIVFSKQFTTPIRFSANFISGLDDNLGFTNSTDIDQDQLTIQSSTDLINWSHVGELSRAKITSTAGTYEFKSSLDVNIEGPYYLRLTAIVSNILEGYGVKDITAYPRRQSIANSEYQFALWKQIRTGEHEVTKKLRQNNIISALDVPQQHKTSLGGYSVYAAKREGVSNFIDPPFSSKYKPLKHTFVFKGNSNPLLAHEVTHTYTNNLSMFANKELNDKVGVEEIRDQVYNRLLEFYSDTDTPEENNPISKFLGYKIEEVVYPKEENTGLGKIRGRQSYILNKAGFDRDGYDRQHGTQRVFWRDRKEDRLLSPSGSINSMGDFERPFENMIGFHSGTYTFSAYSDPLSPDINTYNTHYSSSMENFYERRFSFLPIEKVSGSSLILTGNLSSWIDTINITGSFRIITNNGAGELQERLWIDTIVSSNLGTDIRHSLVRRTPYSFLQNWTSLPVTDFPLPNSDQKGTAPFVLGLVHSSSLILDPKPRFCAFVGGHESGSRQGWDPSEGWGAVFSHKPRAGFPISSSLDFGLKYVIDEMTDKRPWFDSYEDYVDDIRGLTKDFSILPEFRISEHMDYYVSQSGGNFRTKNKAFLTLDGVGSEYRSSLGEKGSYSQHFFKTYINSDTIKHHNILRHDNKNSTNLEKISFKVSGIKKLLPYNGFYPANRTLQLASLYSNYINNNFHGGIVEVLKPHETVSNYNIHVDNPIFNSAYKHAAMEGMFAPGILYNTIKSGISVDWPTITGSADLNTIANYWDVGDGWRKLSSRIPFETIIFPQLGFKTKNVISSSYSSSAENSPFFFDSMIDETNFATRIEPVNFTLFPADVSYTAFSSRQNFPFCYIKDQSSIDSRYSMAMSNFLAEIPKFFLKDEKLTTFYSKEQSKWKIFQAGKSYYMDIVLRKDPKLVMIEAFSSSFDRSELQSRWNNIRPKNEKGTFNGRYFGFPLSANECDDRFSRYQDPAYAAYTPPYHEGAALLRCKVTPSTTKKYTLEEIFNELQIESIHGDLLSILDNDVENTAYKHKMSIESCINLKGATRLKDIEFIKNKVSNNSPFKASAIKDTSDIGKDVWVISPKLETPVLNFSEQPFVSESGSYWVGGGYGRGMWSGYGKIPEGNIGIELQIKESFPIKQNIKTKGQTIYTGSLLEQCGFSPSSQKIGQIAHSKEISEAIVVIPYVDQPHKDLTIEIDNFHFFQINKKNYEVQKNNVDEQQAAVKAGQLGSEEAIQETSISKMIEIMPKYIIPPMFNFNEYTNIDPFVMYIFEFKHTLDQEDLSDIWQGLMPKIGTTAEADEVIFEHPSGKNEFFHGKDLPKNVRWMVFKVKKKAETNYFKVTADSSDDDRFKFDFQVGRKEPEYSYNWPYDFCSLVEFAKVELSLEYAPKELESAIVQTPTQNPAPNLPIIPGQTILRSTSGKKKTK